MENMLKMGAVSRGKNLFLIVSLYHCLTPQQHLRSYQGSVHDDDGDDEKFK